MRFSGEEIRSRLTARERDLIRLAAQGLTDDQAAASLCLSVQTVRSYWRDLRDKYEATRMQIVLAVLHPTASRQTLEPIYLDDSTHPDQALSVVTAIANSFDFPLTVAWGDEGEIVCVNDARKRFSFSAMEGVKSENYSAWGYYRTPTEPLKPSEYPFVRILRGGELKVNARVFLGGPGPDQTLCDIEAVAVVLAGKIIGCLGTLHVASE